jgi:methylenetetrahydrofolate reductase (NADPH)
MSFAQRDEPRVAMSLAAQYAPGRFGLSFELFPPKTPEGDESLYRHVGQLLEFHPSFITCTYGAGGSTRDKTLDIVQQVRQRFHVPVASHLTVVGSTVDQLWLYLREAQRRAVDFIVALRGDPPRGQTTFTHTEGGLKYANELVALIRAEFPEFGIAVAGYPETHQEAPSPEIDLANLKRKVEAGADVVITQLFYQNDDFFRFRERYEKIGLRVPLVPGILPVTNLAQIQRITSLCGAKLPDEFITRLGQRDDADWQFQVGVEFATRQVQGLIDRGVPGTHFYVLNKSQATSAVLRGIAGLATGQPRGHDEVGQR